MSARSIVGAAGGVLWGAGLAVLVQQFGLWPLDPLLAYGVPLAAGLLSGWWGRRAARRPAEAALLAMALPLLALSAQAVCDVVLTTASATAMLADTSPTDPFDVDAAVDGALDVQVSADGRGSTGRVWVEVGGIPVLTREGTVGESLSGSFDFEDDALGPFAGAPGLYHVGGEIDGTCSADGYVRIAGNPLQGPVGQAAAGAVGLGLLVTWMAGRSPAPTVVANRLRRDGRPLDVDGVVIRSPGLDGTVTVHPPTDDLLRSVAGWTDATREALARHHMRAERVVEIGDTVETPSPEADAAVPTRHGDPGVQVELPPPPDGHARVLLASDESGVVTCHLAEPGKASTFRIARFVPGVDGTGAGRGLLTAVGRKVVTDLVFPLLDPVYGEVGERYAAAWEARRRPNRFRTFTPDDYTAEEGGEPDWDHLASGRALLLVHGTFSRAHTAFGAMSQSLVAELHRRYEGRVLAFDHHTLNVDPRGNVEWLLTHLPDGTALDVDIVCHSRGGLVSRVLAEQADELAVAGRAVTVGTVVFVASPNAGTILAEPAHLGDLIDSWLNILEFQPRLPVIGILEPVLALLKQVAVGAVSGLDGLAAMRPGGAFLGRLNASTAASARYRAVTADYEPQLPGWRHFAVNRFADGIFHEQNDLVVPTGGTWAANGSSRFPIEEPLALTGMEGVNHAAYFANPAVAARLLDWLEG